MASATAERQVIQLPVEPGLVCLRGLSPTRLRFEVEYGLERGTTANSFLFLPGSGEDEQIGSAAALLVHPPGASFAEPYLEQLEALVPSSTELQVVVSHVNPNRIALLHELARRWDCLLYTSPSPRDKRQSRMPSSA